MRKEIQEILSRKKADIVKRCFSLTVEAYPPETSELLKGEKDRFLNPVGFAIRNEIENIFDEVVGTMDPDRLIASLENVIKIRAIQNFSPSEAVSFVYLLKASIKEYLTGNPESWTWDAKAPTDEGRGLSPQREQGETRDATQAWDVGRGPVPSRDGEGTWDKKTRPVDDWAELGDRIDRIALLAFDVYMGCREKIHEIRLKEMKAFHGRK